MPSGQTTVTCQKCKSEFIGGHRSLYCPPCKEIVYYTCPECSGPKSYKYSKWCYSCSLKFRDTSKSSKNIAKARKAARSPEARKKRSDSLKGHIVSDETKQKIGQANKGRKHTKETKAKMSKKRRGIPKTDIFRELMSQRMSGEGNPNWKGGIAPSQYSSGWTEKLKNEIRKRDNYTCQKCGKQNRDNDGESLAVHHLDFSKDNHIPENLLTVCKSCHAKMHEIHRNFGGK